MPRVRIITETILEIKKPKDQEALEKAYNWAGKVSDFLYLVRKTLVQDVNLINQKITSIKIEKDRENK